MKKRITALLAAFTAVMLILSSCTLFPVNEIASARAAFDSLADEIAREELTDNILNLHFVLSDPAAAGIEGYSVSLGDFTAETYADSYEDASQWSDRLAEIDTDLLTPRQRYDAEVLRAYLEDNLRLLEVDEYRLYGNLLGAQGGQQSTLPTLLASYAFYGEQDIDDYFEILKQFPDYFAELIRFAGEQVKAGTFMPDALTDKTIDQCAEFIADTKNHFMIDSFNERINALDFLSEKQKAEYIAENKKLFAESVVPSYQYLQKELKALKGKCKGDGRLCTFKNGKEYYELLVRSMTGSAMSVDQIRLKLQSRMMYCSQKTQQLLAEDPDLLEKAGNPTMDVSDPTQVLNDLKSAIESDFPLSPDCDFTVHDVPKSMEKYANPAYYILSPVDNINDNHIYINRSQQSGTDLDFTTLAHEGFPGHLYQTTYFHSTNPALVRSCMSFSGYDEGWGIYAEMYAYGLTNADKSVQQFDMLDREFGFILYCIADIGIHYDGWTYETAQQFFEGMGIDETTAREIYETLLEMPVTYLTYYIGYLELISLQDEAQKALGDAFSEKEFRRFILTVGPSQFDVIRERMNGWIKNVRAKSGSSKSDSSKGDSSVKNSSFGGGSALRRAS